MVTEKKKCNRCGEAKCVKDFSRDRSKKDGFATICKNCKKVYSQSSQGRLVNRLYRKTAKAMEYEKRYRKSQAREETLKRYNRSEKRKLVQRRYYKTAKGKANGKKGLVTYRTRRAQTGGTYTTDEWYNLCKYYDFHCLKCQQQFTFEKLTVDHIKPISKGGASFIWNLQPLCSKCNSSKGDKEIDYRQTLPDWIKRDGPVWIQGTLF